MIKAYNKFVIFLTRCIDPKQLWIRYAIGLSIILVLLAVSHVASVLSLRSAEDNAVAINESGRQRMLSQRMLYFASAAVHAETEQEFADARRSLRKATDLFETSHIDLTREQQLNKELEKLYFDASDGQSLDQMSLVYIDFARQIMNRNTENRQAIFVKMEELGRRSLLNNLNAAVTGFENVAHEQAALMRFVQSTSFMCAIFALMLEGLFIFWPAHVAARNSYLALEKAINKAEKKSQELEETKAAAEYQSLHDPLTKLPNRRFLQQELDERADECRKNNGSLAILHIDLDRFKQINDTLGHAAGDHILMHVADTLRDTIRDEDFTARIGGDEFVIVSSIGDDKSILSKIAERVVTALSIPVPYEDDICHFGASVGIGIGIACEEGETLDTDRLLVNADIALYRAKELGRGRFEFFSVELQEAVENNKKLSDEILVALSRDEFFPVYQAQFNTDTGKISGVEVLVRWQHPTRGLLTPDVFLDVARHLNVISDIDQIVLKQALTDYAHWQSNGIDVGRLSVNVSSERIEDPELVEKMRSIVFPKGKLVFELLESIFFDDGNQLRLENLAAIRDMGIEIEIDDFGTGHASIFSLVELKPNRLKIDRALVQPSVDSSSQRKLLEAIVQIGNSLDIAVIAEGVETMAHYDIVKSLGCNYAQGYALAKPMASDDFLVACKKGLTEISNRPADLLAG